MANLRIAVENALAAADLTVSPAAVSTLPVTNLQIPARSPKWRSTSAAEQVISFDWNGSGYYLNFLMIRIFNLEPAATIRVQLYSDAAWTTEVYDSGAVEAYDADTLGELDFGVDALGSSVFDGFLTQKHFLIYFAEVLALSGKITVNDTGNSDGYVEASYAFAGKYTEFTYNAERETAGWKPTNSGELDTSDGGTPWSHAGVAYREMTLELPLISADQRPTFMDMMRYAADGAPIFAALYPEAGGEKERDYTGLWKVLDFPDVGTEGRRNLKWGARLRLREI